MNEIVIEPNRRISSYWREIYHFRELFFFLAWRDILVLYKQTVVGIAWSVLRPLLIMVVLTVVFGRIAEMPSHEAPYPILVYSAMLPWQFFSVSFSAGSLSLIANASMISKIYFPRIIIPSASIVVSFVDFLISSSILLLLMLYYRFLPDWKVVVLLPLLALTAITSLGAGYWISALNVKYRDFRHIVPFIIQFGLYISPVGFSSDVVPDKWRLLYSLNPMVGVIDGFRWAILGGDFQIHVPGFICSVCLALLLFVSGVAYFRKVERTFADLI